MEKVNNLNIASRDLTKEYLNKRLLVSKNLKENAQ